MVSLNLCKVNFTWLKIKIFNANIIISNKKIKQSVNGNTNTVYINPLNSLRFVLNKLKKDKS